MRVFLDFEASSLGRHGVPIEVAWAFEDGREESHLIRPAAGWDDWDEGAAAIHGIPREALRQRGTDHGDVARGMVDRLSGHALFASAPSWDGKWLSVLLRAAGLPRHALRLRDTDEALAEAAADRLGAIMAPAEWQAALETFLTLSSMRHRAPPAHRALPDARGELACYRAVVAWADAQLAVHAGAKVAA